MKFVKKPVIIYRLQGGRRGGVQRILVDFFLITP